MLAFLWGVLVLATIGCDRPHRDADRSMAEPDPRERFEMVMERFERRYQGSTEVISTPRADGLADRMQVRFEVNDVSWQVHPPAGTTENYTAEVTVRTTTHFSMHHPQPLPEEPQPNEEKPADATAETGDNAAEAPGSEETFGQTDTQEPADSNVPVEFSTRTDRRADTYDFAFEDGRWVLKTLDIEPSVRLAFEYACLP